MPNTKVFNEIFQQIWVETNLEMTASLLLCSLWILWWYDKVIDYFLWCCSLYLVRVINDLLDALFATEISNSI
jgi:hypothetical protein